MCISFVFRKGNNVITAMNFDKNGMSFTVKKEKNKFVILVDGGKGKKFPSFGVNNDGGFINNLWLIQMKKALIDD